MFIYRYCLIFRLFMFVLLEFRKNLTERDRIFGVLVRGDDFILWLFMEGYHESLFW